MFIPEIAYLLIIDSSCTKTFINLIQTNSIFYNVLNGRDKDIIKINSTIRTRITHPNGLILCYSLPNRIKHGSYICRYITNKHDKRLEYGNYYNDKINGRWTCINTEREIVYRNIPITNKYY